VAILFLPFFVIAVAGLILSLVAHLVPFFGFPEPLGRLTWLLHIVLFVVWLPAGLAARRLDPDSKEDFSWKVALRGCPRWVRWVAGGFAVYAVVNFVLFLAVLVCPCSWD
jgi:hypothetical protein